MAIAIDPHTSAAWFNKGIAYQSLGQNDQARQAYDEAIEIEPYLVTHIPKAAELGYNTQVSEYYKTIKRRS
jgi:tetratricopeptide (TPR) repeat protein